MVAITNDRISSAAPVSVEPPRELHRVGQVLTHPTVHPAAAGDPAAPSAAAWRLLLAVVAVAAVLAAGVGTAALGRVLDGQRGIPVTAEAAEAR